jgi:hypothetical protein
MPNDDDEQEMTTDEELAAIRAQTWELELATERHKLREPFVDALERAAEAEARASYLEHRVGELERQLGRHSRLRDAQVHGLANVSRSDLQKIVDETLRDPSAMQQLHDERFAARQRERADAIEGTQ